MTDNQGENTAWATFYRIGGAAALVAALLFRRNLGAEVTLFTGQMPPVAASDWLTLLANNRLLGLAFLNVFDIVNYALVGLIFIGLYAALRRSYPGSAGLAVCFGLIGVGVYFASNQAFAMLSLSGQYAAASDAQRTMLVAAGEALLAINNPGAIYQGTGIYASLFLVTLAGLIFSGLMLRSGLFNRVTAYIGILAHVLLMGYFIFLPVAPSLVFLPHVLAAVPLVIWQLLSGWRLFQLVRVEST